MTYTINKGNTDMDNLEVHLELSQNIASLMWDNYTLENGDEVKGQAISYLRAELTSKRGKFRWKRLPMLAEMDELMNDLGFDVAKGRNNRGQLCTVVYAK